MKLPIYLDYSATTPVDPRVADKMYKYLTIDGIFGNPDSKSHFYGYQAEEAVDIARNQIATLIGSDPREIVFTSGATESDNLAIKGVAYSSNKKGHIITSITEHKAVLDTCKYLQQEGFKITYIVPQNNGVILLQQIYEALRKDTILVSLMHVNNEIGIIQDIIAFGELCHSYNILLHVDATQSVGKLPINLSYLPVDLMSFSSHKLYGPKGIGCLYIRRSVKIKKQMHGGGHEFGIRSGTLPVHQIVGMGEAYSIAALEMDTEIPRIKKLRDKLWNGLNEKINGVTVNGDLNNSVATILNISFRLLNEESLINRIEDIAISSGSACISSTQEPSYVLLGIGLNKDLAYNSLRFSIGRFTTIEEIDYTITYISNIILSLRKNI